jgi:hypothetical protein
MCENTFGGMHSKLFRSTSIPKFTTRLDSIEPQKLPFFIELLGSHNRHSFTPSASWVVPPPLFPVIPHATYPGGFS